MIRKLFNWIFKDKLEQLDEVLKNSNVINEKLKRNYELISTVLNHIDISVDVNEYDHYSPSWAVISLQGQKTEYIKFIDLGDSDISEISDFINKYGKMHNLKIDATPNTSKFLRIKRNRF